MYLCTIITIAAQVDAAHLELVPSCYMPLSITRPTLDRSAEPIHHTIVYPPATAPAPAAAAATTTAAANTTATTTTSAPAAVTVAVAESAPQQPAAAVAQPQPQPSGWRKLFGGSNPAPAPVAAVTPSPPPTTPAAVETKETKMMFIYPGVIVPQPPPKTTATAAAAAATTTTAVVPVSPPVGAALPYAGVIPARGAPVAAPGGHGLTWTGWVSPFNPLTLLTFIGSY